MSILWIEEIISYTPIKEFDLKYEDLYQAIDICEINNTFVEFYMAQLTSDEFLLADSMAETFKWC